MFLNKFIALELWFMMDKLWYYRKKNLWHYGKHYGTMEKNHNIKKTIELCFITEKTYGTLVDYSKVI